MSKMMRTRYANLISKTEVQCIADLSKEEKTKNIKIDPNVILQSHNTNLIIKKF